MRRVRIALLTSTVAAACGGSPPSPPLVTPTPTNETITGTERIGWNQPAADATELATIGYAIYVDGNRTDAAGVICTPTAATTGFPCTARLPALTPGAHTLQIASFVNDGGLLESARSAPLQVTQVASVTAAHPAAASAPRSNALDRSAGVSTGASANADPLAQSSERRGAGSSGGRSAQRVADGLIDVTDLAFASDGRLFVAERKGTIAVVSANARLRPSRADDLARTSLHLTPPATLLTVAIDPEFERTRSVFAIYTEAGRGGASTFTLARFREAAGTLADRAVLLDGIPAAAPPHAALRFGGDGTLVAAFGASTDADSGGNAASYSGEVLRLNRDGTTPQDQPSATPVLAAGVFALAGVAWLTSSRSTWVGDRGADGVSQLREAGGSRRAYRLPNGITPSAIAAVADETGTTGNDLLIASAGSGDLLRVRFDASGQPAGTERVPLTESGAIRALAAAPEGAIYFATADTLFRLR
jgi:glucose/arabinose dehydrogenase